MSDDTDRPITHWQPEHTRAGHTVKAAPHSSHADCDHPTHGPEGVAARKACRAEQPNPE